MNLILLCLLITVYFDIVLFKKRNSKLFADVFKIEILKVFLGALLVLVVLIFSDNRWDDLPSLILLYILPMYLLRRNCFMASVKWGDGSRVPMLLSGALGVIIAWAYGVIVFGLLMSGITSLAPGVVSEMGELIISATFSSCLIMALVYRSSRHFPGKGFLANVGLRKGSQSWFKVAVFSVILGLVFAFLSSYWAVTRQIQPQTPLSEVLETTQSLSLILLFLFLAICIAPLIEEIVFRGYFFYIIKEWLGGRKAIYIIALTFAFLHVGQYWGDWLAIAMVTMLGFTLTILRAWTGTTAASVITHYVYNGSVTIIPIVMLAISNPAYFEYKAYYPQHDAQTKERLLKASIAKQPDLTDAYNDLAWLYTEEERNLDIALDLVDKALSYVPEHSSYLDTKAEVLEKLGRHKEAKTIREGLRTELP